MPEAAAPEGSGALREPKQWVQSGADGEWWAQGLNGKWYTQKQWEVEASRPPAASIAAVTPQRAASTSAMIAGAAGNLGKVVTSLLPEEAVGAMNTAAGAVGTAAGATRGAMSNLGKSMSKLLPTTANVDSSDASPKPRMPLIILAVASVTEFIAGAVACADEAFELESGSGSAFDSELEINSNYRDGIRNYCDGYEAYAVAAGTVGMLFCVPQLLAELGSAFAPRLSKFFATAKLGQLPFTSAISLLQVAWWFLATLFLTFIKPFTTLSNGFASTWAALLAATMLSFANSPKFRQWLKGTMVSPARDAGTRHRAIISLLSMSSTAVWISAAVALGRYENERKEGFRVWAIVTGVISMCMCVAYLRIAPVELPAAPRQLYAFSLTSGACWLIGGVSLSFVPELYAGSAVGIMSTWLSVGLAAHLLVFEPHTQRFWRRTVQCFRWALDMEPALPLSDATPQRAPVPDRRQGPASVSASAQSSEREEREELERTFPDTARKSLPGRQTKRNLGPQLAVTPESVAPSASPSASPSSAAAAGTISVTAATSSILPQSALERLAARVINECAEAEQAVATALLESLLGDSVLSSRLSGAAEGAAFLYHMQKLLPLLNGAPPPVDPDENLSSSEVPHEGSAAVEVAAADPEADPSGRVDSVAAAIPDGSGVGSAAVQYL